MPVSSFFLLRRCACGSWNRYVIGYADGGAEALVCCVDCGRTAMFAAMLIGDSAEKANTLRVFGEG